MADNENRTTPPASEQPRNEKPTASPAKKSRSKRRGVKIDRTAPMHHARVLAMQALYEDDLTGHGLEDILQHIGGQERREHGDYYIRIRADVRKAIEALGYLARNADVEVPGATTAAFVDASGGVLAELFTIPETDESDPPDENLLRNRSSVEGALRAVLTTYRDGAARNLEQVIAANQGDGDEPKADVLAVLERTATRDLEATLTREERLSRETMMDLMARTVKLAQGVDTHRAAIDPYIEQAAPAFPIPQLASIDRGVLRIAVYELLFEPQVPFKAVINEGVEIAKHYGGPNSGRFVNGVLRTISEGLPESRKEQKPRR